MSRKATSESTISPFAGNGAECDERVAFPRFKMDSCASKLPCAPDLPDALDVLSRSPSTNRLKAYNAFMSQQNAPLSERTCRVEMSDGEPCGRPLHLNQTTQDHGYVCLMHSHDWGKNPDAFEQ